MLDETASSTEGGGEAAPPPPPPPEPPPPPAVPEPDGRFTSNCSYVLGDFSESASGFRFVGDAALTNTGNVGIVARVVVTWNQAGSGPVREVKQVKVPYRRSKTVHFTRVASQDEIDLHQAAATGDATGRACKVDVKIVDTFGKTRGDEGSTAGGKSDCGTFPLGDSTFRLTVKGIGCATARALMTSYSEGGVEPAGYDCAASAYICWQGAPTYETAPRGFQALP